MINTITIGKILQREEINTDIQSIVNNFNGKVVLVTGAAGSIGSELCRQLASFGVSKLILFDNAETPMHNITLELKGLFPELECFAFIGNVCSRNRLRALFKRYSPDIVFHAAAYKHVPLMEQNPCEAAYVNVTGSRIVADMCLEHNVEIMVMISTDKAVNPTNIMGASKRLAEIYVQSLGIAIANGKVEGRTKFVTTRFGNVLGSNGSVIPHFQKQIASGGPVTVTHPEIIRYFMTIPEACRLVVNAATMSNGHDIYIFDMGEQVKIVDLAERMIRLSGYEPYKDIDIIFTGLRPGEKLYEELLSSEENTIATSHKKIRIANVRKYDYSSLVELYDELERLSIEVEVDECVKLMKRIVPEFISNNSKYEEFDK